MINSIQIEFQADDAEPPSWINSVYPFADTVLQELGKSNWELSILFCDNAFIQILNSKYRMIDAPTDVLSFALGDLYSPAEGVQRFTAGDIVISLDMLAHNAETFNVSVDEELRRLLVHGILHLTGMDHATNSPSEEMLQLQERILEKYAHITIMI